MYILLIALIIILSLAWFWWKIGDFLLKHKKYVSGFIYVLCLASFLYLSGWHHAIKETWEKALDLLFFLLFLPILASVLNLSFAKKLMIFRKEIWILMWVLAIVHTTAYFTDFSPIWFWEKNFWFFSWEITYLAWWFLATIIAIVLTITSNIYSQKLLWKKWKLLHKTVYILLIFALLHVIFLKIWWRNDMEVYIQNLLPLAIYIVWKFLQYKKIVLIK